MRLPLFCPTLVLIACASSSEIVLEVPEEARADSATAIILKAKLRFRGFSVADDTEVRFKASAGSFAAAKAVAEGSAKTTGGEASIAYYPPNTAQDVTLSVSFTNVNEETINIERV